MTVELRPLNVLCNIQCRYCYQEPQRAAGAVRRSYDLEAMKAAILSEGGPFTLFGGEPLLLPLDDLTELWEWGYEQFGRNQLQTNGTLITDAHIELFKRFNVHVGMSMDGPDELNDARWHGTLERTRTSTARSAQAIERLCSEGVIPSLIVTLHRLNASRDTLPRLVGWIRHLGDVGVQDINLHLLESESPDIRRDFGLSTDDNIAALFAFLDLETECPKLRFELFHGIRRLLQSDDRYTSCVWYACDPYTTRAVRGVEGHGQRSNCGRTNKEGIDFVKAAGEGFERYIALYHTPQEHGGCRDCRFFLMCKGQCPGTAIDGDWRNRTEHCEVWMALLARLEEQLLARNIMPLSQSPRRIEVERQALETWTAGRQVSVSRLLRRDAQPAS